MDVWAPVVRHWSSGTGQLTNDINSFSTALGVFTIGVGSADCAAHGSAGDKWADAYGEFTYTNIATATNKAGIWLRVADSSNYYAVYITIGTPTTMNIDAVVAGAASSLLSTSFTPGTLSGINHFTLRAEVQGNTLRAYWQGVLIGSAVDNTITAPGFVSMFMRVNSGGSTNIQGDRFEAGPLGIGYTPGYDYQQVGRPSTRARRLR
jgi:hypothetical protein